ncbi:Por secretion system C-terminal sorting domain-containing protein [Chitinophaga jiangningensis]|uniref:Por secretion system C-terminal sorting domain-containing protein n=1 Tax=Chitinophaga jiangningensis TaxID=1419482 RepID=A0A1M7MQA2_9BACT|nr:PKD domain-containing protein [Chitinophaga jiangningensis]SHM93129.1 Por secretion system C-terminal sorting domain-containing protein [Chitinophaga jiangningensis]
MNNLTDFNKRLKRVMNAGLCLLMLLMAPDLFAQQGKLTARVTGLYNPAGLLESLPQGYSPTGKKFPLLLFFHGLGEEGNGTTEINRVIVNGPPKLINQGAFPATFKVGDSTESFIVLCPQFRGIPNLPNIDSLIEYAYRNYNVDTNRVYLTGLSRGGGVIWGYVSSQVYSCNRAAAIVPICGAYDPGPLRSPLPIQSIIISSNNLPVWALHNENDPTVPSASSKNWVALINAYVPAPNPLARLTIFNASGHDAWSKAYDPNYREEGKNVYEWMLQFSKAKRGGVVTNKPPTVNAGTDFTLVLPNNAQLDGSATKDPDGTVATYKWTQTAGPNTATIATPAAAKTAVSGLIKGTYTFRLTAIDDKGASAFDDVVVTVQDVANTAPTTNAGADIKVVLPASAQLDGSATKDADGTIATYKWTQTSGPNTATITTPAAAKTTVSGLVKGVYVFRLTATDNGGLSSFDEVQVTVEEAVVNKPPQASAGADVIITLPVNSVQLDGSGSRDADGSIASYNWSQTAGPNAATITGLTTAQATAGGLIKGVYTFRLTVKDNGGLTATDDVQVTVQEAPVDKKPPVAIATAPETIILPANSVTLNGSTSHDPDGNIVTWAWTQISGPGVHLAGSGTSTATATDMPEGVYGFKLVVTDNDGLSATASVKVVVVDANDNPGDSTTISYYPNPTRGKVRLEIRSAHVRTARVTIFDLRGQTEFKYNYPLNGVSYIELDLGNLPNGVHIIDVRGEDKFKWAGRILKF